MTNFVACNNAEEKDTENFIAKYSGKKKAKKKWHSVAEDGLPSETEKCYLVYCADNGCQFTAYVNSEENNTWWLFGAHDKQVFCHITHWRELPKNP